jgi:hypothetical protein
MFMRKLCSVLNSLKVLESFWSLSCSLVHQHTEMSNINYCELDTSPGSCKLPARRRSNTYSKVQSDDTLNPLLRPLELKNHASCAAVTSRENAREDT